MIGLPPVLAGAVQVRPTWPLPAVATSPVGAPGAVGGGGVEASRNSPARTAVLPPVLSAVIVTVPPAATVIGAWIQAPWTNELDSWAVWGPWPSLIVTVW